MKLSPHVMLVLSLVGFSRPSNAAEPQSKELKQAQERYEAAMAAATKPVNDRYLQELEQLKSRALGLKNLAMATEIEQEIKRIAPPPPPTAIKTAADLERYLGDTTWSWGASEDSANSRLRFQRDGTCAVNKDKPLRWTAADDSTVKLENGATITFRSNHKGFTAETPTGKRVGRKL